MSELIILDQNAPSVQYLCAKDKRMQKVMAMVGPITYRPYEDSYAFLVSQIIGQMLSNKAAAKIYQRLEALCQGVVSPEQISALSEEEIKSIGTSGPKVQYIRSLTKAVLDGAIDFGQFPEMPDEAVAKKLMTVRGIGAWSAKMYLIFVLNRPDVLPYEDAAFLQGYGWAYQTNDYTPAVIRKKCKKWQPYSSIAARYLYRALDLGLTKQEFHLFQ